MNLVSEKPDTMIFNCSFLSHKPAGALIEYSEGFPVHTGMDYEANSRLLCLISTMPLRCGLGRVETQTFSRVNNYPLVHLLDLFLFSCLEWSTRDPPKFSSFITDCDCRFPGMLPHVELSRAYGVLGLQQVSFIVKMRVCTRLGELNRVLQGATMEEVKTSYKKLALQYHPDKNKAEDATETFQEIGSAYNTIVKHLERPSHDWADDDEVEGMYHCDDDYYENDMEFLL